MDPYLTDMRKALNIVRALNDEDAFGFYGSNEARMFCATAIFYAIREDRRNSADAEYERLRRQDP